MTISTDRVQEIAILTGGEEIPHHEAASMARELLAHREAVKPADDTESILHALQIMAIGAPYSDIQGQLYCHRPYSPDGYRDAEFRDYGLARAVRIICNNAKAIAAALKDPANVR